MNADAPQHSQIPGAHAKRELDHAEDMTETAMVGTAQSKLLQAQNYALIGIGWALLEVARELSFHRATTYPRYDQ